MAKSDSTKLTPSPATSGTNWIIWGSSLTTLVLWTTVNDPFNAPKSWILSIAAFWLLGWILFQLKRQLQLQALKWAIVLSGFFILALTFALIATDNKYIGFFGEYQRRTGYLTYISLTIFFLASAFSFRLNYIVKLEISAALTGFFVGIYGISQHFKHDFTKFSNPYNPVIATLGNPDFAAAAMSIFLLLSLGIAIQSKHSSWLRWLSSINVILLFISINYSQVRQGILTTILGIVIILIVWLHQKSRISSYTLGGISMIALLLALAGMLQKGPFVKYFFKSSVTFRGDYWRAGWRMFSSHPFFGVGLDRYGANFRQYRDATQEIRRGPDLISNAAHNVPLQLAATGGIFLILTFLALTAFILWRGIATIKSTRGSQQILASVIFAAWVAYEAQSMISIDNIGIAIWGYVLGGAVVGISIRGDIGSVQRKGDAARLMSSNALMLLPVVLSFLLYKSESGVFQLQNTRITQENLATPAAQNLLKKPLSFLLKEPAFQVIIAQTYANAGDLVGTRKILEEAIASDSLNYPALSILARLNEVEKRWDEAVTLRKKIQKIDPYNTLNLLELGEDIKSSGDITVAKRIIPLIDAIDPNGADAKKAHSELGR
jgi:O-antigen ligase